MQQTTEQSTQTGESYTVWLQIFAAENLHKFLYLHDHYENYIYEIFQHMYYTKHNMSLASDW